MLSFEEEKEEQPTAKIRKSTNSRNEGKEVAKSENLEEQLREEYHR